MRLFALLSFVIAALGSGLALGGCGSSDQLPEGASEEVYDTVEDALYLPAYLPSYRRCLVGEIERRIPPEELLEIGDGPLGDEIEAATNACKRANPRIVNPKAAPGELVPLRLRTGSQIAAGMEEAGASAADAACAQRRFRQLSDADLIRFVNAPVKSQIDQGARIYTPCLRESGN